MSQLRRAMIRLASTDPDLRPHLLTILAREAPPEQSESEEKPASGAKGKGPGKMLLKFLDEVGDKTFKNPETGNTVKMKTLSSKPKDSPGHKVFQREFELWMKALDSKEKVVGDGDKPAKEPEPKPKDEHVDLIGNYENFKKFTDEYDANVRSKLKPNQKNGLYHYTGSAYETINIRLRKNGGLESLSKEDSDAVKAMDSAFDSDVGKLPVTTTVRRGATTYHPLYQLFTNGQLEKGMTFTDNGYTSSSLGAQFGGSIQFEIEVPKGSRAIYVGTPSGYSQFAGEKEIILDRGTTFEVVSFEGGDYDVRVKLRVVSQRGAK